MYKVTNTIEKVDPQVADIIRKEETRQHNCLQLIASENVCSDAVLAATGSVFNRKYAEGYAPVREMGMTGRYYGGCENYNELEELTISRFRNLFDPSYWCNVQPHSGTHANQIAYASVLDVEDRVVAMDLSAGAHISHFSKASYTSKIYNPKYYGLDKDGFIDYNQFEDVIREHKPKLVVAGASSYSREIDFATMAEIVHTYGAYFMCDIAHISTLCAYGLHQSPFGYADIVTTTCQKIMRSTRGGVIFCKQELAKKVDRANFPRMSGGSLGHAIAGKCVGIGEASTPEYEEYLHHVVLNSKAMAEEFTNYSIPVVTGGTDNHLLVLDLSSLNLTGKDAQDALDTINISTSKQAIPSDTEPFLTSGLRLGSPAQTTRGSSESDFRDMACIIKDAIFALADGEFDTISGTLKERVADLINKCER